MTVNMTQQSLDINLPAVVRRLTLPSRSSMLEFTLVQTKRRVEVVDLTLVGQAKEGL